MTAEQRAPAPDPLGPIARYERSVIDRINDFNNPRQEWRRLFSELLGTFLLVLAAAGAGMMGHAFPGAISHGAAVVAPALTVMAIILFMGKVSGAHLNPAVSIAFALRRDFPWWRVPGYIIVQLAGATLAALFLHAVINVSAKYGSNYPAHGYSQLAAFWMELILTAGLVSVILGTASGAQNVGIIGAFGVGGYIALAGLWGSPISGASMNPARTFGPDLASGTFTGYWVYIAGPLAGAAIAVAIAFVLRGMGGGKSGASGAQGDLFTETYESGKSLKLLEEPELVLAIDGDHLPEREVGGTDHVGPVGGRVDQFRADLLGRGAVDVPHDFPARIGLERMTLPSGIPVNELDPGTRPQDDLFRHVNGRWLARTEIPADRARDGAFRVLAEEAESAVREIVEEAALAPEGSEERKFGDLYAS